MQESIFHFVKPRYYRVTIQSVESPIRHRMRPGHLSRYARRIPLVLANVARLRAQGCDLPVTEASGAQRRVLEFACLVSREFGAQSFGVPLTNTTQNAESTVKHYKNALKP